MTDMNELTAFLNGLGTGQLVIVAVIAAAAVWTIGRLFTLVEVLVRGHAPADPEIDELVEVLERIEDALGERGHLAGCVGDVYTATDGLADAFAEHRDAATLRGDQNNEHLEQLIAAVRSVRVAVLALDDETDDEGYDADYPDEGITEADLDEYAAAFGVPRDQAADHVLREQLR